MDIGQNDRKMAAALQMPSSSLRYVFRIGDRTNAQIRALRLSANGQRITRVARWQKRRKERPPGWICVGHVKVM